MIKLIRKIFLYFLIFYIFGIFLCNFLGYWDYPDKKNKIPENFLKYRSEIVGEVISSPIIYEKYYKKRIKFYLKIDRINSENENFFAKNKNIKIFVDCNFSDSYFPIFGQKIKIYGKILKLELPNKYNNYLKYQKIYYKINENSFDNYLYFGKGNSVSLFFGNARQFILSKIQFLYTGISLEILPALIVGDKGFLEENTKDFIKGAGISHIIAISGMHIAFLFAFVCLFFRNKKSPIFLFVVLSIIWFYAGITGFSPSCIRACFMLSLILVAGIFDRETFSVNNLIITCAIMLIINPRQLFMLSFLFSFLGIFSIFYFQSFWKKLFKNIFIFFDEVFGNILGIKDFYSNNRIKSTLKNDTKFKISLEIFSLNNVKFLFKYIFKIFIEIFIVSLAAQTLLSPFVLFYFGNLNLSSIIFNLTIVPFLAIIMNFSFISIIFSIFNVSILNYIAKIFVFINSILIEKVFFVTNFLYERVSFFLKVNDEYIPYYLVLSICIILFFPILRDIKENKKYYFLFLIWIILFLISFIFVV
jgi:ComEC/Rec2-related protein